MVSQPDLSGILTEAEANRRRDRAASTSAVSTSTPASTGDYTVGETTGGPAGGTVVVLDENGYIPAKYLPAGGGSGSPRTFDHTQSTPSTTWVINHGLGGFPPPVIVVPQGGNQVQIHAEAHYPDANHVVLKFGRAYAGEAHFSL